jgi:uncharacterized OB-fold protein
MTAPHGSAPQARPTEETPTEETPTEETPTEETPPRETPPGEGDWLAALELAPDAADAVMRPLYEAAARGALALPFCAACATPLELEQYVCDACGASAEIGTAGRAWRDVPLAGAVHAATLVHRREPGLIVAAGPYPVIDVELASGHRLVLTTATPSGTAPDIGAPVEIAFRTVGAVTLPAVRFPRPHRRPEATDRRVTS